MTFLTEYVKEDVSNNRMERLSNAEKAIKLLIEQYAALEKRLSEHEKIPDAHNPGMIYRSKK